MQGTFISVNLTTILARNMVDKMALTQCLPPNTSLFLCGTFYTNEVLILNTIFYVDYGCTAAPVGTSRQRYKDRLETETPPCYFTKNELRSILCIKTILK